MLVVLAGYDLAMIREIFIRHPDVRAINLNGTRAAKIYAGEKNYMIRRKGDGSGEYDEWPLADGPHNDNRGA